ncbi:MAG: exo-beta-N-acetylmuramidase NamZ domain-containing protein, partial [Planctomycetota bacterium]
MKSTVIILSLFAFFSLCRGAVETGLDRITAYEKIFRGKRIGIITNHTAYDSEGRYIVDVFRVMPDATVAALFSPEHGLWGAEQAGRKTDSQMHPTYNLPIRSLYGKTRKPTPQMLSDIDVLVFDIQDIGARFYTYIYTMSLA